MRSRTKRVVLVCGVMLAAAAAAWLARAHWLPHAGPWAEQAWKTITRPGADTLPPGKQPATQARPVGGSASEPAALQLRKCVQDGRTTYTDQACPPGAQALPVDGAVTSFPR